MVSKEIIYQTIDVIERYLDGEIAEEKGKIQTLLNFWRMFVNFMEGE